MNSCLKKSIAILLGVGILAGLVGCSKGDSPSKPEGVKSEAGGLSVSSEPTASPSSATTSSDQDILSGYSPFSIVGYDYEPGDFAHKFELSDAQLTEFLELLQTDRWKETADRPEYGITTFLRAVNADGNTMEIGKWDDQNTFINIRGKDDTLLVIYLAPIEVVEAAKAFRDKLKATEPLPNNTAGTEFAIDDVKFELALPEGWTATGNEIFEGDRKVAELLPCVDNSGGKAFERLDAQYADAVAVKEFTAGTHSGKYYHMQTEIEAGGVTAKQNELFYYLETGSKLLPIAFYPAFGMGIGTQREAFEAVLNTIGFHS